MLDWKKYFKLPLKLDDGGYCNYIWHSGKGSQMAFSCLCEPETEIELENCNNEYQRYVDKINGSNIKFEGTFTLSEDKSEILYNDTPILYVRGWGMLTGIGGYKLPARLAREVQDSFIEYCVNRLNK